MIYGCIINYRSLLIRFRCINIKNFNRCSSPIIIIVVTLTVITVFNVVWDIKFIIRCGSPIVVAEVSGDSFMVQLHQVGRFMKRDDKGRGGGGEIRYDEHTCRLCPQTVGRVWWSPTISRDGVPSRS